MDKEKNREAQRAACRRYYQKNKDLYKVVLLRLNKKTDADVIEVLDNVPNKTSYVKELVRKNERVGS